MRCLRCLRLAVADGLCTAHVAEAERVRQARRVYELAPLRRLWWTDEQTPATDGAARRF